MKRKTLTLLLSLLFLLPSACLAEEITITVKGMVCSFCAQGIKKTFLKNENVKDINVDLDKKLVTIETKDGASIDDASLRQMITDAGFEIVSIVRGKDA